MSHFPLYSLFLLFCYLNSSSYASTDSFIPCLTTRNVPQSIIYTTHSKNYTSVLQEYIRNDRFKTSQTLKPTLILTPTDESQVGKVVICAKAATLHLRIRSGGHDYEGLSYTSKSPFAILDMLNLRSIQIDLTNQTAPTPTAWVQSGATLGELYYKIWETSETLAFPAGVCPTLGIGGHISGGGYGNLLRKYGLSIDNVVDARVVDASGRILDREAMGEDLFWAIRGGGAASFAVVLAFKVKLVTIPNPVTVFEVTKTQDENATEILHRWQFIADKFDNDLFVRAEILPSGNAAATVTFVAMYLGNSDDFVRISTTQFPELGLEKHHCKEMSWIKAAMRWAKFPDDAPVMDLLAQNQGASTFKVKSDYVTSPISITGLDGLLRRIGDGFTLQFNPYGGRMNEIPATAAAFPHREGNIFKIQYFYMWNEVGPGVVDKHLEIVRDLYDYMEPFVSKNPRRAFLNYRDIEIGSKSEGDGVDAYNEAKIYGKKYFGDNFDRLVRIKSVVDPSNFFSHEQSIPPLPNKRIQTRKEF
ncbi:berberine bridge enzyme-like 8 [Salvia hispanica]|uniref:berberine bridge enzyme-like 8 n=1 Tax=Salvia hispanica TaxID=49212 RepID=UPI002009C208|nr:berberine bridge enzyme-like 8 [Salvia hispanica]